MGLADGMAWEQDYPTTPTMTAQEEKAWKLACSTIAGSLAWSYDYWWELPQEDQDKWLKLSFSNKKDNHE